MFDQFREILQRCPGHWRRKTVQIGELIDISEEFLNPGINYSEVTRLAFRTTSITRLAPCF